MKSEEKAGNVVQYRDKDAVLSGLEQTLPYLRGKDRADVLMKIASQRRRITGVIFHPASGRK